MFTTLHALGASGRAWFDFKPSKPYYGFKYDLRHITQHSIGEENGLRCKLGPQCGKNIQKLADAPSFYQTSGPQGGSSL